jgi:4-amino-4-deoxy-L-arabinose transferase-like glycosyltransferase
MTSWIFSNNMLEVTMTMFLLASAYLQLRAIYYKPGALAIYYFLAGGFLALAVLSKNVAGLFPLIIPMLHFIIFKKISLKKAFLLGIFTTMAMVFCTCTILYLSDSIELYKHYIQYQLVPSVAGTMPGEDTGFLRNVRLIVSELAIPALLSGLVMLVFKKWTEVRITRLGLFFLILGLSGTLPLFLIHKFRSYYLFPGLPFFVLFIVASFSTVYSELEKKFLESGKFRLYTNLSSVVIIAAAVVLFFAGRNYPVRLKEFKHDVYDSSLQIPERGIITNCSGGVDYTLIAAFQRYYKLSLLRQRNLDHSKWILEDKHKACDIPKSCKKINREDTIMYNIYECSTVSF